MSKLPWKDSSSWGRSDTAEERAVPKTWGCALEGCRITITRHRGYPGQWVLFVVGTLTIDDVALNSIAADDAKAESIRFIVRRLKKLLKELSATEEAVGS